MLEEEIKRLEDLFRLCQVPPVLSFALKGLQSEVEVLLREFPQHSRLVVLNGEIVYALKQALKQATESELARLRKQS